MPNAKPRPDTEHPGLCLHTIPHTACLLGNVSEMHVYRLIADGELRAVDIARRGARRSKTRVRSDDLDDYIKRSTRTLPAPATTSRSAPQ
jgi:excisionase family DNA binding protein